MNEVTEFKYTDLMVATLASLRLFFHYFSNSTVAGCYGLNGDLHPQIHMLEP